jgi:hypothetical protein
MLAINVQGDQEGQQRTWRILILQLANQSNSCPGTRPCDFGSLARLRRTKYPEGSHDDSGAKQDNGGRPVHAV